MLGNLPAFVRDPTGFLTRLARDHGDVVQFRLGRQNACQFNHPALIRDVLLTNADNFTKTRGLDRARRVIGNGLLTSEGEVHRAQRRRVQPAFQRQRIEAYGASMIDCAVEKSSHWQDGQQIDMFAEMLRLTLSIVGHTLFLADTASNADVVGEAMTTVFEYFDRLLLPWSQVTERLPFSGRRSFERARDVLDKQVFQIIAERRAEGIDRGDLLSMLLFSVDTEGDSTGMTDQQARDEIMTMFLAGHETTATALTWTWYLLANHPEIEAQLHSEIERVLGRRKPTVSDLTQLRFARMVLAESMRLYPPVWTLTRRAISEYRFQHELPTGETVEYVLPAGTIVGMSQFVTQRDARFFPDPERFDPSRWSDEDEYARLKYVYFPFGGGVRRCIGEGFAWMEATLLLATLCQNWQGRLVDGHQLQLQPLITLRPKGGLPMTVHRRPDRAPHSERPPLELACHESA